MSAFALGGSVGRHNRNGRKQMGNLTNDMITKANAASQDFKNKLDGTDALLDKSWQDASKTIGTLAKDFANSTSEYVKTSRDYVKENPAKGVAMGAAVGLVCGYFLTWVMRKNRP